MTHLRLLCFLLFIGIQPVAAQQLVLKANDIQLLIEEWNIIHNARVVSGFANVYDDSVMYYGKELSRDSVTTLKTKQFDIDPDLRQRITSDVIYTAYASGVFKCDFKKEILDHGQWKTLDSYLLVSYEGDHYVIVGESDVDFDEENGTAPDLGEELAASSIVSKSSPRNPSAANNDTIAVTDTPATAGTDEYFTMPKGFIFMLVAFIVAGGLLIFIMESIRIRRQRTFMTAHAEPISFDQDQRQTPFSSGIAEDQPNPEALSTSEKQTVFESYVLTLFDPLFFKYERSFTRSEAPASMAAIIELVFHNKAHDDVKVAVLPLFVEGDDNAGEWQLFDVETLQQNHRYSEENKIDLYYIIGHGGSPENPHELFLLPAHLLKYELVAPQALQPFRKTGMFFYNAAARKLQ